MMMEISLLMVMCMNLIALDLVEELVSMNYVMEVVVVVLFI